MTTLLLYDTTEKDLARDLKDLLTEIGLDIGMIPLSPNLGKTLQAKEEKYIDTADGMIFLITPGSERLGKLFPSPSLANEMGQAKQKFKTVPEKVIYLVDNNCDIQAIDQRSFIQFNRTDVRKILEAITLLFKDLKQSGLLTKKEIEPKNIPGIRVGDIAKKSKSVHDKLKQICFDLSNQPEGFIALSEFDQLLRTKYRMGDININFIKRDLVMQGLVLYKPLQIGKEAHFLGGWQLTDIGFEIVRYELKKQRDDRLRKKALSAIVRKLNVNPKKLLEMQRRRALENAFKEK